MPNSTGGKARVPEEDLKKNHTDIWRDKTSPSEYPHSKQASS